jgi:nitrilase
MGVVAVVQVAPTWGDSMASSVRAAEAITEAAEADAWLAVFPETYLPGAPDYADRFLSGTPEWDAHERRFLKSAITVPGPETDIVSVACRENRVMVALGVTERPTRSGTLYNTLLWFDAEGTIIGRHRKVVPTDTERMVWSAGDGTTLRTITTAHGIVGGLICWENFMPLARTALYAGGIQIHVAPTMAQGRETWVTTMRHIANEGRMWVVSPGHFLGARHLPTDLRAIGDYTDDEVLNPGGSMIVDPQGTVVAGPLLNEEGILYADCDPETALLERRTFDAVGHYGRGDILELRIAGVPFPIPVGDQDPADALDDHIWRVAPQNLPGGPEE